MMTTFSAAALNAYTGPWLVFWRDRILVDAHGELPRQPWPALQFLHHYAGQVQYLPPLEENTDTAPLAVLDCGAEHLAIGEWQWVSLRQVLSEARSDEFRDYARAWQYVHFLRTHRFCGQCGGRTEAVAWEMAVQCHRCQHRSYPRISPCIIVAIYRPGQILLARGVRHKQANLYSTLAGFVESGETLEQALHREVHEEVGVQVKNLQYFGSQPWPFPHSLMVGYLAEYAGGEIVVDDHEIVDAHWFDLHDLPTIPPKMSIAGRLIEAVVQRG